MTPPLAHRLGTRLISLGVLLHGYGTLLLVRRTRPARVTMTHGGVIQRGRYPEHEIACRDCGHRMTVSFSCGVQRLRMSCWLCGGSGKPGRWEYTAEDLNAERRHV